MEESMRFIFINLKCIHSIHKWLYCWLNPTTVVSWSFWSQHHCNILGSTQLISCIIGVYFALPFQKIVEYSGPKNFRAIPNPYVFLLFEQSGRINMSSSWTATISNPQHKYNFSDFQEQHQLIGKGKVSNQGRRTIANKSYFTCPMIFTSFFLNAGVCV